MQYDERTYRASLVSPLYHRAPVCIALLGALLAAACRSKAGEDGVAVGDNGAAVSPGVVAATPPAVSGPAVTSGHPTPGRTVDVRMVGDASGYRFVPATVTIKSGDTVRWTNVAGGPHNVTFWSDSIPAGALTPLQTGMPQQMSPLSSQLLTAPNATYAVSFAGAPAGKYAYYCMPHLALGMKATIVVEP
jgi:plastocyanin